MFTECPETLVQSDFQQPREIGSVDRHRIRDSSVSPPFWTRRYNPLPLAGGALLRVFSGLLCVFVFLIGM